MKTKKGKYVYTCNENREAKRKKNFCLHAMKTEKDKNDIQCKGKSKECMQ